MGLKVHSALWLVPMQLAFGALNKVVMETTFPELELFVSTILFETVGSDVSQHTGLELQRLMVLP